MREVSGGRLPPLYFGLGHVCLLCAFAAVALDPAAVAGFYYHPRMLAVVHLVTLGWITASILGALYAIVPSASGSGLAAGRADLWVFAGYVLGATGMASHFWIEQPVGMVWSAGLAAATALWVVGRAARALRPAAIPAPVKAHLYLAFANLLLAALLGVAVGVDKLAELLPGASLDHVVAHAHLAALGWASMTVMAGCYLLLPGMRPAERADGRWIWAGALLTEAGVVGLSLSLYSGRGPLLPWGALTVAGLALFSSRLVRMRRRRPPAGAPRLPAIARLHLGVAFLWLPAAAGFGLAVTLAPAAAWRQQAILVYGAAGLVGFLSQLLVAATGRILPAAPGARRLQPTILVLWILATPLLATALALDARLLLRTAATLLALAAALSLAGLVQTWRTAPERPPPPR